MVPSTSVDSRSTASETLGESSIRTIPFFEMKGRKPFQQSGKRTAAANRGELPLVADQNHGGTQSVFVPFFSIPAATLTSTSRIAAISGAAVVPFYQARLPGGEGYLLVLCPALENFPSNDPAADTRRLNSLLEDVIREIPEQYLWVHRRFKTRPEGAAYPYD